MEKIISMIAEISDDSITPKNVKERLNIVLNILKENIDCSVKINKALHELDEVVNENNMEQFTRTQIWNIVSMLEKFN